MQHCTKQGLHKIVQRLPVNTRRLTITLLSTGTACVEACSLRHWDTR